MILVRSHTWWHNKVPLSILLMLLLLDGRSFSFASFAGLVALIAIVSCCANYGYALNELFDQEEDARGGRLNVAAAVGDFQMWIAVVLSATGALILAAIAAGLGGLLLTIGELLLPLAYSVPPLRIKEKKWLGVCSDAVAAHVYPAALALIIVFHQGLRPLEPMLVLPVLVWAAATGLRSIVSHQLRCEDLDRKTGLTTVVHELGHERILKMVLYMILPIEWISFLSILVQCDGGAILLTATCVFVAYGFLKTRDNLTVPVFNRKVQAYLPFVEDGIYKVWGPLIVSADAALHDALFLVVVPIYMLLFWRRVYYAWRKIHVMAPSVFVRMRSYCARDARRAYTKTR